MGYYHECHLQPFSAYPYRQGICVNLQNKEILAPIFLGIKMEKIDSEQKDNGAFAK